VERLERSIYGLKGYFSGSLDHFHATIHILNDLSNCIYAWGFCDGFYEGIVSLMSAEYPESIIVSTVRISGGEAGVDSAGSRKNSKPEKCLKMQRNSHRPMHDVFGSAFLLFSTNNF
jgi:hypothetical protein